jgi:hypothetical protein
MATIAILLGILIPTIVILLVIGTVLFLVKKKAEPGTTESESSHFQFGEILFEILGLALLIANVFSFLTMVFVMIDKFFPDALNATSSYAARDDVSNLHSAIALIAITLPLTFLLSYMRKRSLKKNKGETLSVAEKYGIFATMFTAAITLAGSVFSIPRGRLEPTFFCESTLCARTFTCAFFPLQTCIQEK